MNSLKAAALIHSRTAYCDFRTNFLARPREMSQIQIEKIKEFILQTTQSIEDLYDDGDIRKIVYADDNYVILGITAYIKDIYSKCNEVAHNPILIEERGRPTYIFAGLVFPKSDCRYITSFPKLGSFINIIERYVVPRWNEKRHSDNVDIATLTDSDSSIMLDVEFNDDHNDSNLNVNAYDKVKIFTINESEAIITASIAEIAWGKKVATCTNFAYKSDAEDSYFMNISCKNINSSFICSNGKAVSYPGYQKSNKMGNINENEWNYSTSVNGNTGVGNKKHTNYNSTSNSKNPGGHKNVTIVLSVPDEGLLDRVVNKIMIFLEKFNIKYRIDKSDDIPEKSEKELFNDQIKKKSKMHNVKYTKNDIDIFDIDK
jgi:hypothetical protein